MKGRSQEPPRVACNGALGGFLRSGEIMMHEMNTRLTRELGTRLRSRWGTASLSTRDDPGIR